MVEICHVCKTEGKVAAIYPDFLIMQQLRLKKMFNSFRTHAHGCVCVITLHWNSKFSSILDWECVGLFPKEVWTHICAFQIGHRQQAKETAHQSLAWCSNEFTGVTSGAGRRGCLQEHGWHLTDAASLDSPAQVAGNVAIDLRLSSEESSSCFCSSTLGDESSHLLAACVPWTTPFPLERMLQFSGRQLEYFACQIPLNTSLIQCHTHLSFRRRMDAIKILYASPRKMASAKCPPRIVKVWIGIQHSHKGGSNSSTRMWRWDRNIPGAHQPAFLNQSETLTQKNEEEANWGRRVCKCVHKLVT